MVTEEGLELEFGLYSQWLAEACLALGADPVPALARGTGRPALLELLARPLDAKPGKEILDIGCGLGAPGAWLGERFGADVFGVDLMLQSVAGIRRLGLALDAVVASLAAMPIKDGSFDGAWSLGVLEMVEDKERASKEIWRVLKPGASVVIYDFVLTGMPPISAPGVDRFSVPEETVRCLEEAGFQVTLATPLPELADTPADWAAARDSVRAEVRDRHGEDERFKMVERELQIFRTLCSEGVIRDWVFVGKKEDG
jgi:SAM-dependent methyltransferase